MSESFLLELRDRLRSLGVRRSDLDRVLAEVQDHLREASREGDDPVRRFGDPRVFARMVAAELATTRTRRATFLSFAALALAGSGYVLAFALVPLAGGWPDIFAGHLGALGPLIAIAIVLLPQIAFVSGCLALVRALRVRRVRTVAGAELALLRRRSNVALAAAAGALLAFVVFALNSAGTLAGWWTWTTLAMCAVLLAPLAAASYVVSDSGCPAVETAGPAGDIFDDLGPLLRLGPLRRIAWREHTWRFAVVSACVIGLLGFAGGWYAEGDPGSGIVRGGFEAVALVICFAALGRILGLRRTN
jgi:hypothetical protein